MEYLPYPDLTGLMTKLGYFFTGSLEDAACILRDMSSALAYLEEKDILHNDIKPANILYDDSRGAVLIDFGLASFSGKVCNGGTPWYVPQEFMAEGKRGFASDVFALGVTGLYLLKRSPLPDSQGRPWAIQNANRQSDTDDAMHMEAWLENAQALKKSLDDNNQLEAIVRKMLQSEPERRLTAKEAYKSLSCSL
jgi:serine/threonine protein kinase